MGRGGEGMNETPWTDRLHYKYGLSIDFFHGVKEIEITLATAKREIERLEEEQIQIGKSHCRVMGETVKPLKMEIERLKERLAIEIKWGHQNCTPENCLSSGEDCPAALAGAGETEKEVVR